MNKKENKKKRKRFANTTESKIVAARQEWKCNICHELLSAFYEVDHLRPWARGGGTELSNLQALCVACHKRKSMFERIGRCHFCQEKTVHSRFFPCPVIEKSLKMKKKKRLKKKEKT